MSKKVTKTTDQFIEEVKNIHGKKYQYDNTTYVGVKTKVKITCPTHGEFEQTPNNHLNGKGCPQCGSITTGSKNRQDRQELLNRLNTVHNGKYQYDITQLNSLTSLESKNKIDIKCPVHGWFKQIILNHLYRGNGCEKCGNNKLSKGESMIEKVLVENNVKHFREYTFDDCINPTTTKKLPFDFYLPNHNICIEYDGRQHFMENPFYRIGKEELIEIQRRDDIKNSFCKNNNIELIRITYLQVSHIPNILKPYLNREYV